MRRQELSRYTAADDMVFKDLKKALAIYSELSLIGIEGYYDRARCLEDIHKVLRAVSGTDYLTAFYTLLMAATFLVNQYAQDHKRFMERVTERVAEEDSQNPVQNGLQSP